MTILSHIGNITLLILASILIVCSMTFNGYAHQTLGEPHFHDEGTSRSISENASRGTAVGDPVSAHSVVQDRYVMSGSNDFEIDAKTGQLKTKTLLDYNIQSTYTITVTIQKARVIQKEPNLIIEYNDADSITVTINVTEGGGAPNQQPPSQGKVGSPFQADTLPSLTAAQQLEIVRAVQLDTLIFNEVFNASTDTHDWLELRNITDTDVDLSGWRLVITTSEKSLSFNLPEGTILSGGEVFLLLNTDPNAPDMSLAVPEEASYQYLVDKEFILPQADFTILLRSPDTWQDAMGNYFFGYEVPRTVPSLTADIAWAREKPSVIGTRDEAWAEDGLGTPGHHPELLGDVNRDGTVNILDLVLVASQFGQSGETVADINGDGTVNIQDLVLVANGIGDPAAGP